jgi:hypothetical protein
LRAQFLLTEAIFGRDIQHRSQFGSWLTFLTGEMVDEHRLKRAMNAPRSEAGELVRGRCRCW